MNRSDYAFDRSRIHKWDTHLGRFAAIRQHRAKDANRTAAELAAETVAQIQSDLVVVEPKKRREAGMCACIAAWERHYGDASNDVHRAIDEHHLVESRDVTDWITTCVFVSGTSTRQRLRPRYSLAIVK